MDTDRASPGTTSDRALAILIADATQAAHLARAELHAPGASAAQRAFALGVLAMVELREGDAATALQHLEAAAPLVDVSPTGARAAALLDHARAQWHRLEGRLGEAEALLRRLHAIAESRPAVDAYLSATSLGTVLSMLGDAEGALDHYYQSLALARRSGEDSLVTNALNNLGSYQSDLYNLEDAAPLLEECLAGALRVGSRRQIIYAAGNLVQCLCLMGQAPRALAVAREHLIGRIRPDDAPALQRNEEIAHALLDNGLVDDAAAVLGNEAHADPYNSELATSRVWLQARVLLARGEAEPALELCLARRELLQQQADETTLPIDRVCLLRLAAQAADQAGRHDLAYRLLAEAFETHEALLGRAARSRQLSLQITHRLGHAEWERDAAQQMAQRLEALNASLQAQVAENDRLQQQLRAQALEDPLTGTYNRRHLIEAGSALLSLMRRRAAPMAVALLDLDHFKQVNDRHGHEAGDRVLCAFAELARHHTRAEDLLCRYGGEEFVLLLPGANAAQAAERLGHLLGQFRALRFEGADGAAFSCSFSAGVVDAGAGAGLQALLTDADVALYAAKAAGRARVHRAAATA